MTKKKKTRKKKRSKNYIKQKEKTQEKDITQPGAKDLSMKNETI